MAAAAGWLGRFDNADGSSLAQ